MKIPVFAEEFKDLLNATTATEDHNGVTRQSPNLGPIIVYGGRFTKIPRSLLDIFLYISIYGFTLPRSQNATAKCF